MNLILFFFIIIISFIVVRMGAVAFQLTGLEWSLSKFQALSCFTGTGFTTREAELIVGNVQRRRIATALMVLGNVGFVGLIATFANSLKAPPSLYEIEIPYIHLFISSRYFPWVNLALMVLFVFLGYLLISKTRLLERVTKRIKKRMIKRGKGKTVTFEEIVISTGGYGLLNVDVTEKCPVLNQTIQESGLRDRGISVLVIERKGHHIAVPSFNTRITLDDSLICFGQIEKIKEEFYGE